MVVLTHHRIGNLLGEEKAKRAGVAAKASILMSLGISLVWRCALCFAPVLRTRRSRRVQRDVPDLPAVLGVSVQRRSRYVIGPLPASRVQLTTHLSNSEVVTLVASILPVVALFQVFDGLGAVTGGILRAAGKQVCTRALPLPPIRLIRLLTRPPAVYRRASEPEVSAVVSAYVMMSLTTTVLSIKRILRDRSVVVLVALTLL